MAKPSFFHEKELYANGHQVVAGIDEAGCGALAGPVVAAAVVLPMDSRIGAIRDSKLLSAKKRARLHDLIVRKAYAATVGIVSTQEVMDMNVRAATFEAMRRALRQIEDVDFALVDAWTIPGIEVKQKGIIKGDKTVKSIAAASIIAKVTRDLMMLDFHETYPQYGFDKHKGYGTRAHREAIKQYGPCPIHRLTYKTFR